MKRSVLLKDFKDKEYAHAYVDDFLNSHIAMQIKVLREQQDLTQKELADLAGMKQARISVLENVNYDMWSISTLKKLAEAFDVTLCVSFESFTKRIDDIVNLSRESLQRVKREEDLVINAKEPNKASVNLSAGWVPLGGTSVTISQISPPLIVGSIEPDLSTVSIAIEGTPIGESSECDESQYVYPNAVNS